MKQKEKGKGNITYEPKELKTGTIDRDVTEERKREEEK